MSATRLTLVLLLVAGGCGACHRAPPRFAPGPGLSVGGMVAEHCRDCHMRSVSDKVPEALAVFDLDDPNWFAGIPSKSFYAFKARLLPFADARTARELLAVIDAELSRRQRLSTSSPSESAAPVPLRPQE